MCASLDRHLPLLHRLEQRGLCAWRGAVDLVDQQDVGEDRPLHEAQRVALEDRRAGDVDRQQIGRALHARRLEAERLSDSSGQQRLASAGYVLQQHVPVGKEGQGRQPQWLLCPDYCLRNRGMQLVPETGRAIARCRRYRRLCRGAGWAGHRHRRSMHWRGAQRIMWRLSERGRLAQWLEHSVHIRGVTGSNPVSPTKVTSCQGAARNERRFRALRAEPYRCLRSARAGPAPHGGLDG